MTRKTKRGVVNDSGFDWKRATDADLVVLDYPLSKLACFANKSGEVVLVAEDCAVQSVIAMSTDEALDLMRLLKESLEFAVPIAREREAEFLTFCAIDKAQGKGGDY